MNERIKQLALQASKDNSDGYPVTLAYGSRFAEKFAELIVGECMTRIQEVKDIKAGHAGPEYTQGFDDGMFVAISTIEEHFGVEEK